MYFISFGEIEINMGEDLTKEIVEILLYMFPEDFVQKMIESTITAGGFRWSCLITQSTG